VSDEENKAKLITENVTVPLEPYIPEGLGTQFANNFSIMNTGNEVFLSFYQPEVPFVSTQHPLKPPIRNRCVARLVLTPTGLKALADALNQVSQEILGTTDKSRNE